MAAERLTEVLGEPLPFGRPPVAATAVGHLVRAGLLAYLGADVVTPDVHPEQVAALARRRDLPALLDRYVPLGPDQAAVRLGVRRTEWDYIVRLGWIAPVGTVTVDYKRARGGVTDVPLTPARTSPYCPSPARRWTGGPCGALAPGRRSPLAALDPVDPAEGDTVLLTEVARMTGVGRAAVANWRRRHDDFPASAAGTDVHPRFDRSAVVAWLLAHDKVAVPAGMPSVTLAVWSTEEGERRFQLDDPVLELSDDAGAEDRLSGWMDDAEADALAVLAATYTGVPVRRLAAPPLAVLGGVRVIDRFRSGSDGLRGTVRRTGGGLDGDRLRVVPLKETRRAKEREVVQKEACGSVRTRCGAKFTDECWQHLLGWESTVADRTDELCADRAGQERRPWRFDGGPVARHPALAG